MTTAELRKDLKALGYKLTITSNSLGRYASIIHKESGITHGNVEIADQIQYRWAKFGDYVTKNRQRIIQWAKDEGVFGYKGWFDTVTTSLTHS